MAVASGWTCNKCTLFIDARHGIAHEVCPVCKTTRPVTWRCNSCTAINENLMGKCLVCDTLNFDVDKMKIMRNYDDTWNCPLCAVLNNAFSDSCFGCNIGPDRIIIDLPSICDGVQSSIGNEKLALVIGDEKRTREQTVELPIADEKRTREPTAELIIGDETTNDKTVKQQGKEKKVKKALEQRHQLIINEKIYPLKLAETFDTHAHFSVELSPSHQKNIGDLGVEWKISNFNFSYASSGEILGNLIGSCFMRNDKGDVIAQFKTNVHRFTGHKTYFVGVENQVIFSEANDLLFPVACNYYYPRRFLIHAYNEENKGVITRFLIDVPIDAAIDVCIQNQLVGIETKCAIYEKRTARVIQRVVIPEHAANVSSSISELDVIVTFNL
jgi:rubredoxin